MEWVVCPRCGFTQIPSERCLRCQRILEREELAAAAARDPNRVAPQRPPVSPAPPRPNVWLIAAPAIVLAVIIAGIFVWRNRAGRAVPQASATVPARRPPAALDLAGRWQAQSAITLPGAAPRPAVTEVSIETDREGQILGARVLLTDPGRGGAGAGYRMTTGARDLLDRIAPLLAEQPKGTALPLDFLPLPPWIPPRPRLWRALEGQHRGGVGVSYLLLESLEDDYLVQAGVNQSGFLSYAFFSPEYAPRRGVDALSGRIHPAPDSSLRGFQNVVWDFSGAADFLKLEIAATLSEPAGAPARLVLRRER